jgi:hypothetical protein
LLLIIFSVLGGELLLLVLFPLGDVGDVWHHLGPENVWLGQQRH